MEGALLKKPDGTEEKYYPIVGAVIADNQEHTALSALKDANWHDPSITFDRKICFKCGNKIMNTFQSII